MGPIWLLSRNTLKDELTELERRHADVTYIEWKDLTTPVATFPAVARWMLVVQDMTFQLSFMEELERGGTRVINPARSVLSCDKASECFLWQRYWKNRILAPDTIMTGKLDVARDFIDSRGVAVCKPVDGQGGAGVVMIHQGDDERLVSLLGKNNVLFLQAFVASTHEIRTIVVGDAVVAQYARFNPAGFHNLGSGGVLLPLDDPRVSCPRDIASTLENLALDVAGKTGLDLLAFDALIDAKQQPWFLEWNPFFAHGGKTRELGFDIASKIATYTIMLSHR